MWEEEMGDEMVDMMMMMMRDEVLLIWTSLPRNLS
jgi:hypothetical protein